MKERLRRLLPTQQALRENRWLRWLGPALHHPRLWHMSRRGIALGVGIGVFFAFLIPIAQIPFSAAVAVALRANVPTAVASTLVTNPVTFPPVYYAAWRVGNAVLGSESGDAVPLQLGGHPNAATEGSWFRRTLGGIRNVGKPLLVGLVIFAIGFSLATYMLVNMVWHLQVRVKRWRRRRRAVSR
jgi:hypothetical protein